MTPAWRRAAGIWGPLGFVVASVAAARRLPAYSHRRHHISGLAAQGAPSAPVMVSGFLTLAAAQAVLPAPTQRLRSIVRLAGITTLLAGAVRVSDPKCPQPGVDPDATASDVGHGAASIATFALWVAIPLASARDGSVPDWYRGTAKAAIVPTLATFTVAGVTTRLDTPNKGSAQRAFLCTVFVMLAATGFAGGDRRERKVRRGRAV